MWPRQPLGYTLHLCIQHALLRARVRVNCLPSRQRACTMVHTLCTHSLCTHTHTDTGRRGLLGGLLIQHFTLQLGQRHADSPR